MGARDDFLAAGETARDYPFSDADFERVRQLIYARAGISLNDSKHNMVYSRLARRLRATGMTSFAAYLQRLEADVAFNAGEAQEFINALTTNLTSFFRENHHFPVLHDLLKKLPNSHAPRVWCAAASTGEEPYSIAMTMIEALGAQTAARLFATDIDTNVLDTAVRGVYTLESARSCGEDRLRRFFLRGSGANEGKVRVRQELAKLVEFAPLNLLSDHWPQVAGFARELDAVFCRNVMIYFDKPTQRAVLARIARQMKPGALLFVGHSENFSDCRDLFILRGKTVYERVA